MKAVIVTAPLHGRLGELSRPWPQPLVPFLNRPLLEFQVRALRRAGFAEIGLALATEDVDAVYAELGRGEKLGVNLSYLRNDPARGPAGALKDVTEFADEGPFLAVEGDVVFGAVDFGALLARHGRCGAVATLGITEVAKPRESIDNLRIAEDGRVVGFTTMHAARDRRRPRRFTGLYVFEGEAFDYVPDRGFFDIKEQLLPTLHAGGCRVAAHELAGFVGRVESPDAYYRLQCQALASQTAPPDGYRPLASDVWVEDEVSVSESARLVGPLLVGSHSVIGPGAQVVGPAVIGRNVRIEPDALVRESVLWDGVRVPRAERLAYAVKRPGCPPLNVAADAPVATAASVSVGGPAARPESWRDLARLLEVLASKLCKRSLDIAVSTLGLALGLPLFAVVALAIKLDSRGPALFVQRRLGRQGREFPMIKFRTMVIDAERMRSELASQNDVDGPIFKIFEDPRVTRVGKILRATSVDELPQLLNVLAGHMSLVGPRPLAEEELRCSAAWRDIRLRVRPGITGLWQVSGRSNTGFRDWIVRDTEYVLNQSLLLDLKILRATVGVVLRREGTH